MSDRVESIAELLAHTYGRHSDWPSLTPEQKQAWRNDARTVLAARGCIIPKSCGDGCSGCDTCRSDGTDYPEAAS